MGKTLSSLSDSLLSILTSSDVGFFSNIKLFHLIEIPLKSYREKIAVLGIKKALLVVS